MLRVTSIPCTSLEKCPSPDCDGVVHEASNQKGIQTVIVWECPTPYSEQAKKRNCFLVSFGKLELKLCYLQDVSRLHN